MAGQEIVAESPAVVLAGPDSIFGFGDALTALTLIIVFYTFTDARYRFRLAITPWPIEVAGFVLLAGACTLSLVTDIWFAMKLPGHNLLGNHLLWQSVNAGIILSVICAWMYRGFVRPLSFSHKNAKRFFDAFYSLMLRGTDDDLKMIANELARSAPALVRLSQEMEDPHETEDPSRLYKAEKIETSTYAYHALLLMGGRKICRHIVSSSPITAIMIFQEMSRLKRPLDALGPFAVNVSSEAISNSDSPMFHEGGGYYEGLLGYWQPFKNALFGDYQVVHGLGERNRSPLDISYSIRRRWTADQFRAYCDGLLLTWKSYLSTGRLVHSTTLYRAIEAIGDQTMMLYKIDGADAPYDTEEFQTLNVAIEFFREAVECMNQCTPLPPVMKRPKGAQRARHLDSYDLMCDGIFKTLNHAMRVTRPRSTAWEVQHNQTWSQIFWNKDGPAWPIIHKKLIRLIYDEIVEFQEHPNFVNAAVLGYCINVMGPQLHRRGIDRVTRGLHKLVLRTAREHFLRVRATYPKLAEACLIGSLTFDEKNKRIVKTYVEVFGQKGAEEYLDLA